MAKDFVDINRLEDEAGLQATNTVSTADAKQDITSRFVAMWEKKNAQRALRGGAVSTMALTLAACGGDDDDPVAPAEPPTPVVDLVENAGVFSLATDVDGFSVPNDGVAPEITISDDEPDDQITATLDANGAGSGTLVLDFIDVNDTLTLTKGSDFGSFTTLEIQDGTVDVSLADLGPIENVTINSGIILTSDQLEDLNSLSGDGDVEVKVGSAEEADDVVAKIEELGVTAPVTIIADDDATITDEELDAANTAAEAAVEENNAAEQPSLTADKSEVDEGGVVTFTISTQNVAEGTTLNYTITGVDGGDISGELTGTATVDANGNAVISVGVAEDQLTEGAEDLTLSTTVAGEELTETVTINDTSMTPVPTFDLTASAADVDEGGTATFTLATTNVAAGAEYNYALSGVSADDLASGSLSGTATVDANGEAVISVDLAEDELTEGAETLELEVAGETAEVTVNDTSVTQPQSFTLTANPDSGGDFTGGGANDTYTALGTTFTTGDDLDGAGGTDVLNLTVADNGAGGTDVDGVVTDLTDIEQISVRNVDAGDDVTLDAASWTGVEQLSYDRGSEGLVFQNVGALATVGINEGGAASDVTVTYDADVVAGTADSQTFVLENADATTVTVNGVETFVVNSATGTNEIDDLTGDAVATYTLQGDADITIGDTRDAAQTIDASTAGGAVTVTIGNVDTDADGGFVYTGADGVDELNAVGGGTTDLDEADAVFTVNLEGGADTLTVDGLLSAVDADASLSIDGGGGSDALLVSGADAFDVADIADGEITSIETVHADLDNANVDTDVDTTAVGGLSEVQIEGDSEADANDVTINDGVAVRILETADNTNGTVIAVDGADANNTVASQSVLIGTAAEAADGGDPTAADLDVGALGIDFTEALTITAESDGDERSHTVGNITNTNNVLTGMTLAASSAALTIGTVATADGAAGDTDVVDLALSGDNDITTGEITLGANTNRLDVDNSGSGARAIDLADIADLSADAGNGQAAGEGIVVTGGGSGAIEVTAAGADLDELIVDASGYTGGDVVMSLDNANAVDASNFDGVDQLQLAADNEDNAVTGLADGITITVITDQGGDPSSFELANGGVLNVALDGAQLGDNEGLSEGVDIFNVSELVLSATDVANGEDADVTGVTSDVRLGDDSFFDKLTLSADAGELEVDDAVIVDRASETSSDTDFEVDLSGAGDITVSDLDLATNDGGAGTALEITDLDINAADGGAYTFTVVQMGGGTGDAVSIDLAGAGDTTLTAVAATADEDITITSNGGGDATENQISAFNNQTGDITVTGSHDLSLGDGTAIDIGDGDSLDASDFTGDLEVIFDSGAGDSVTVTGGSGENTLTGGDEDATIIGGDNDDTIEGNGGSDTITTGGGSDTIVFEAANDGVDTYTDFDFGDAVDVIQGAASADIDEIGGNGADAVSTAFDGGNVTVADLAADTSATGGDADIFVISDALDQAAVALNDTVANIEAAIADQLSDGDDFLGNTANGADEGALVLIQNDGTGGSDGFFLAEVRDSAAQDQTTVAAEVNLIGIFEGTDALNAAAADFI